MQVLPFIPSQPLYTFNTTITDTPGSPENYRFDVHWNTEDQAWYFDVREQDGTLIAGGVKIVLGANLGRRIQHRLFRDGIISALDTTWQGKDAGFDDIGTRVKVLRIPINEVIPLRRIFEGAS